MKQDMPLHEFSCLGACSPLCIPTDQLSCMLLAAMSSDGMRWSEVYGQCRSDSTRGCNQLAASGQVACNCSLLPSRFERIPGKAASSCFGHALASAAAVGASSCAQMACSMGSFQPASCCCIFAIGSQVANHLHAAEYLACRCSLCSCVCAGYLLVHVFVLATCLQVRVRCKVAAHHVSIMLCIMSATSMCTGHYLEVIAPLLKHSSSWTR